MPGTAAAAVVGSHPVLEGRPHIGLVEVGFVHKVRAGHKEQGQGQGQELLRRVG